MTKFLIFILAVSISCTNQNHKSCLIKSIEDYDEEIVAQYNSYRSESAILIDSLAVNNALEKMEIILTKEPSFIPAIKFKAELYCKVNKLGLAIKEAEKAYNLDRCDIYTLPYIVFLYDKNDEEAKAQLYLEKAFSAFEARCEKECNDIDFSTLLFLKLYSEKISLEEYQEGLTRLGDEEHQTLSSLMSEYTKSKFLKDLCSM